MVETPQPPPGDEAQGNARSHLEAHAGDNASVIQSGRDTHYHHHDGVSRFQRTDAASAVEVCPYPGLAAFGPEHAVWFYGREQATADLRIRLAAQLDGGGLLMVVAPSGAGKSSLLRAGLLPSLDEGRLPAAGSQRWPRVIFTPGSHPLLSLFSQLATAVGGDPTTVAAQWAKGSGHFLRWAENSDHFVSVLRGVLADREASLDGAVARVVVVVDQFEEIFTQCTDERERRAFIELLCRLGESDGAPPTALVVAGLRADFYAHCVNFPRLRAALQRNQILLGAMTETEVRQAILFPARDVGLDIEPGLVELLLRDLDTTNNAIAEEPGRDSAAYEAGRLPLLAHALRATWQQHHGATLTVSGYKSTGGIDNAVATSAEHVYGQLDEAGQQSARALFLSLIRVGDGTQDTRRRVLRGDLPGFGGDERIPDAIIEAFTRARLLTQEHDTIAITHDALLHAWPRLRLWLGDDRLGHLIRQDLYEAAERWALTQDAGALLRGARLETASKWAASAARPDDVSTAMHLFLEASLRHTRNAVRIRRFAVSVLVLLLLLSLVSTAVAIKQTADATRQARAAIAQNLIARAEAARDGDPRLALQLGLAAMRIDPSTEARESLSETLTTSRYAGTITGFTGGVGALALAPDGRTLAVGSQQSISVWDTSDPHHLVRIGSLQNNLHGAVTALAWMPDSTVLLAGDENGLVVVDMSDLRHPQAYSEVNTSPVTQIASSDDGNTVVMATASMAYILRRSEQGPNMTVVGRIPVRQNTVFDAGVFALSHDGHLIAVVNANGAVQLWGLSDPAAPLALGTAISSAASSSSFPTAVALSLDDQTLAVGDSNGILGLWDVKVAAKPRQLAAVDTGLPSPVAVIAFDPLGFQIICADDTGALQYIQMGSSHLTPLPKPIADHTNRVTSMTLSGLRRLLFTASFDGTVLLWDLADEVRPHHLGTAVPGHQSDYLYGSLTVGGDIVSSSADDGKDLLWEAGTPGTLRPKTTVNFWSQTGHGTPSLDAMALGNNGVPWASAISPDGHLLATATGEGGNVQLWDSSGRPQGPPIGGQSGDVLAFGWTADSKVLISGDVDGTIILRNAVSGAELSSLRLPGGVAYIAVAATRHLLVAAGYGGIAGIWDIADPAHPVSKGQVFTGMAGNYRFSVALSPDGTMLAVGDVAPEVILWDISQPSAPHVLATVQTDQSSSVSSLAFSPDSTTLASGSVGGTIQLWDLTDRGRMRRFGSAIKPVDTAFTLRLAFLSDGQTLVSQELSEIDEWDVSMIGSVENDAPALACAQLGGSGLDRQSWSQFAAGIPYQDSCST